MLRLDKFLPVENTLAYLSVMSVTKDKFGACHIKHFTDKIYFVS
jgi:hypothetical protein